MEYSTYVEHMADSVVPKSIAQKELKAMNFREFAKTISHNWKQKSSDVQEIGRKREFKSHDVSFGHWILSRRDKESMCKSAQY